MESSLSRQLKSLATPQTDLLELKKKKKSVLFSPNEAATISEETYYEIGISGFQELSEVNSRFLEFKESLFGVKTKSFQRAIQTKEVNLEIDKIIESFLLLLSPYLQKQSALKALEWLVQRFLVHELNKDSLMMSILPYHETVLFIRILQVIDIRDPKSPWNWMNKSQHRGRPLPKQTVYLHWSSDPWFRNFLSKYFRKMLSKYSDSSEHLRISSSLLISTQIGGLAASQPITENHVASIHQTIIKILHSDNRDLCAGGLIIVSQLAFSASLSQDLLNQLVLKIFQIANHELIEHACISLLNLFYYQEVTSLDDEVLRTIESNKNLMNEVIKIAKNKPVGSFFTVYVESYLKMLLKDEQLSETVKHKKIEKIVEIFSSLKLLPEQSAAIIKSFVIALGDSQKQTKNFEYPIKVVQIFKVFELNHPDGFDLFQRVILSYDSSQSDADLNLNVDGFSVSVIKYAKKILNEFKKKFILSAKSLKLESEIFKQKELTTFNEKLNLLRKKTSLEKHQLDFVSDHLNQIQENNHFKLSPYMDLNSEGEFVDSLRILLQFLKVFLSHQTQKSENFKLLKNEIYKPIFQIILCNVENQIYFLSMIWSYCNEDQRADVPIDVSFKVWSLKLFNSIVRNSSENFSWIFNPAQGVIFSLLSPLIDGGDLSDAALEVFCTLSELDAPKNCLLILVKKIAEMRFEISADTRQLAFAIAELYSEKTSSKVIRKFVDAILSEQVPRFIKSGLLFCLTEIKNVEIFVQFIPFANVLLGEIDKLGNDKNCSKLSKSLNSLSLQEKMNSNTEESERFGNNRSIHEKSLSNAELKTLNRSSSQCLYYILHHYTSKDSNCLSTNEGWVLFKRCIYSSLPVLRISDDLVSPQEMVSNFKLIRSISEEKLQNEIIDMLMTRVVTTSSTTEALKLKRELKKLSLSASRLVGLIQGYDLVNKTRSVKEARERKLKQQKTENCSHENSENWRKFELLMELVGVMPDLNEPWVLIGPICSHLQSLLALDISITDKLTQQILSVILCLLKDSIEKLDDKELLKKCELNVALIVQVIRTSLNPDTHRRALLILSTASKYFREQVLHNVMSIFTFMGTSLMRRDDSYSFHVIHMTISSIVPTLLQVENQSKQAMLKKLSQVCQVFVDALPDLADHRRLPLFMQFAQTIGVQEHLWIIVVLITEAYVIHGMSRYQMPAKKDSIDLANPSIRRLPSDIHFTLLLCDQFPVVDQLYTVFNVMEFVSKLPEDKQEIATQKFKYPETYARSCVINLEGKSALQLRQVKYSSLGLLIKIITCDSFLQKIYEFRQSDDQNDELKDLYKKILEICLSYLKEVNEKGELEINPTIKKFWSAMRSKLMDLIDAVNCLLPDKTLVQVVADLLKSNIPDVRCRALEILASKLKPEVKFFQKKSTKKLIALIPNFIEIGLSDQEPELNRQTAVYTQQLLVRFLGQDESKMETLFPIMNSAVKLLKKEDDCKKVLSHTALLIADCIQVLKTKSICYLEDLVVCLLDILRRPLSRAEKLQSDGAELLIIAAVTALHKAIEVVPKLLPAKSLDELLEICCLQVSKNENFDKSKRKRKLSEMSVSDSQENLEDFGNKSNKNRKKLKKDNKREIAKVEEEIEVIKIEKKGNNKLEKIENKSENDDGSLEKKENNNDLLLRLLSCAEHLIGNVELRVLIPAISRTYEKIVKRHWTSISFLMRLFTSLFQTRNSAEILLFKGSFVKMYTRALGIRELKRDEEVHSDWLEEVEGGVVTSMTSFLLKMDEDTNISTVLSLLNWAANDQDWKPHKLISFFRFTNELASILKTLFIKAKVADVIFDFTVSVLDRNNASKNAESSFGCGKEAEKYADYLLSFILDTLEKIFIYDSIKFVNEERFNVVLMPLLSQIENTLGDEEAYETRVTKHLKPCIVSFAKNTQEEILWKEINRLVLQFISVDNEPRVILSGLEILEGLIDSLGEDYLQPLLPDTIACVSEALESSNEDIQTRTKAVYLKMESIVGESLKTYLDS